MAIVFFSDNRDPPVGMYDYGAVSHPIHEDARAAKALAELRKNDDETAALRIRIADLTRPHAESSATAAGCSVVSLDAYREFLRLSAERRS